MDLSITERHILFTKQKEAASLQAHVDETERKLQVFEDEWKAVQEQIDDLRKKQRLIERRYSDLFKESQYMRTARLLGAANVVIAELKRKQRILRAAGKTETQAVNQQGLS